MSRYYTETFLKISQEKRDKIIDSAIIEFSKNGFNGANINNIAQNAGISIGSMYKYFGSKEDLYLAIIHHCVEITKAVVEEIINSDEDLIPKIEKIIRAIQLHSRSYHHMNRLYVKMTTEGNAELVWKIASDMENATAGLYASLIREAQKNGIARKDIDANYFAFFLDNLFLTLQFSYSCEYYKQRLRIFVNEDVLENDEMVLKQLMSFIKGALFFEGA